MKTLATITEQDINPDALVIDTSRFRERQAARAVIVNGQGEVALLHVANKGYHKLPGGGVEADEDLQAALHREVLEEVGCRIEILSEVGKILEYRDKYSEYQTSFCYLAQQVGELQSTAFTEEEQTHGFAVQWAKNIEDAIAILAADAPGEYDGKHIVPRDLHFLRAAKPLMQTQEAA
jgi:8-oxo-dGTP diphosphatase